MSLMLLTDDNVRFIKTSLCEPLHDVKSAHLTEALAFGAGYKTNAAMLAKIKSIIEVWPLLVDLDASLICARLQEFGYTVPPSLDLKSLTRSPDLPRPLYVTVGSRDLPAVNKWFRRCQAHNMPYIYIEQKRKYARLHWDCISLLSSNEAHVHGKPGTQLMKSMFAEFQRIARQYPGKPFFEGASFVGSVENLIPECAAEMAERFFEMLYQPLRGQSNGRLRLHA